MTTTYEQGMSMLRSHFGDRADAMVEKLGKISSDFADINVTFPFGQLYQRSVLDQKTRELLAIAAITCLGAGTPQLRLHAYGAMNVGATKDEIFEVIIQMIAYAGFPFATNALFAASEGIDDWEHEQH